MDEIRMVRDAYGSPRPPTEEETSTAFAQLDALIKAEGDAPVTSVRRRPAGRAAGRFGGRFGGWFGGWRMRVGVGLLAAGTAAAAVIVASGQGDAPSGHGPGHGAGSAPDASGHEAFMQVAAKAELLPTGRYWYSDQIQGQSYMQRPKTGTYAIIGAHSETFQFTGADKKYGSAFLGRDLPARPATADDIPAWKRAGSPTSFRVWSNDHYYVYKAKATAWQDDPAGQGGGGTFTGPPGTLTPQQIAALPTDPDALAKLFFHPERPGWGGKIAEEKRKAGKVYRPAGPRDKLLITGDALKDMPLPPKVRAGLMRALAKEPGIRTLDGAVDPLGRKGVALTIDPRTATITGEYGAPKEEQGTYTARDELVFDPATGDLLSDQLVLVQPGGPYAARKPGSVINYWILRKAGWTDTKPQPPSKLPF
ncbi:hypothetical protein [Actinomadura gamaensis]|uniref:CU044_5270 family protein n=1 Tax=Actinomadura gamaensis TaxID=1763541 RepID=A0ABV9UA24_9ACTN